jgi:hypothetical protein
VKPQQKAYAQHQLQRKKYSNSLSLIRVWFFKPKINDMKKFLCLLLLITGLNAIAQTEKAFFTRDSASMLNISNLIVENAKNKYHLDKVLPRGNSAEIWYRNEDKVRLTATFKFFPDRSVVLTHVTGNYDDIFLFWKKYFDADAQVAEERAKVKDIKVITTPFLNGKALFYFARINSQMGELKATYDVDPTKN